MQISVQLEVKDLYQDQTEEKEVIFNGNRVKQGFTRHDHLQQQPKGNEYTMKLKKVKKETEKNMFKSINIVFFFL